MEIHVPVRLYPMLRKEALAAMAREFAKTMGVTDKSSLDIIAEGIADGILKSVEILLYDSTGEDKGYVFFEVDWELHQIIASTGDSEAIFQVDVKKNIATQIAPVTDYVTSYLKAEADTRDVTRRHIIYDYASNVDVEKKAAFKKKHELHAISDETHRLLIDYKIRAILYGDDSFSEMSVGGAFKPSKN